MEGVGGNGRSERAGRVERPTGPEDAYRMMSEESAHDKTAKLDVEKGG